MSYNIVLTSPSADAAEPGAINCSEACRMELLPSSIVGHPRENKTSIYVSVESVTHSLQRQSGDHGRPQREATAIPRVPHTVSKDSRETMGSVTLRVRDGDAIVCESKSLRV